MARKSRKETAAVAVQEADAACRAAIYVRLSVEDTHTHSVSIETQQMIIARYLEQYPEISVYDTYIDNGATGTNFHRPGFQQMLSDIEAGHVNCVIVKDLSRLGRNTIDTGYYIEQYFRIRSIRFIAVNENFDTANPEDAHSGIIIPLRPVTHALPVSADNSTRPPLAHPQDRLETSDRLSLRSGRYQFFARRSFRPALSSIVSASSRFSLAFSSSSARSRFASETSRPPYLAFQL